MQEILESDDFTTWFGVLRDLIYRHDLTDSEVDPNDFIDSFLDGDSQMQVLSYLFNYEP